ncbi:MAG TPA: sigma-54 dependent transcriptional regulator [Bryobacteraceae bacterium]|nr:sigma-54 dependent transcriptional regulator [Bryobacteraceae bacterium]
MIRVVAFGHRLRRREFTPSDSQIHLTATASAPELLMLVRGKLCDVALLDVPCADAATDDLLLELRRADEGIVVVVRADASPDDVARLVRLGAWHVLPQDADDQSTSERIVAAAESRRGLHVVRPEAEPWRRKLVGSSEALLRVVDIIRLVGSRRSTVLITGETGTGKEVVARALHAAGGRGSLPFVAVNCSAIPETLMESELFGHAKGAFTGAQGSRAGKFEQANGGTIFLDEIGDLPLEMQAKLLRVLQDREVQRLGSSETCKLNVRVIAATNADLDEAVRQKRFREDLYYRLNVVPLRLPSLRERSSDIPALVDHFLDKICSAEDLPSVRIAPVAMANLQRFTWPGNVRQLEHAVEMAVVLSNGRAVLDTCDFPLLRSETCDNLAAGGTPSLVLPDEGLDFEDLMASMERSLLQQALVRSNGNKARAAQLLRMKRTTLLARIKSLDARELAARAVCA